jgi:filamentous hemagglutinin family protein
MGRLGSPLRISFVLILTLLTRPATAQVKTDGSLGPKTAVAGPDFKLPASLGKQVGPNLFHSFEEFSIPTGGSATFQGPESVQNVLARVTGGKASNIAGRLSCDIPAANLYLINPAGVVFGPGATLDVQGSFAVTTADQIRLAGGGLFPAGEKRGEPLLTSASPAAFGFLARHPADVTFQGATFAAAPGRQLTVVGGGVRLSGAQLSADGGRINLVAGRGPGAVAGSFADPGVPLDTTALARRADVTIDSSSRVQGGHVQVSAGNVEVSDSSISASAPPGDEARSGPALAVDAAGTLKVAAGSVATEAGGAAVVNAGRVQLDARESEASISSARRGGSGELRIRTGQIDVLRDFGEFSTPATISAKEESDGFELNPVPQGRVQVTADRFTLNGRLAYLKIDAGGVGHFVTHVGHVTLDGSLTGTGPRRLGGPEYVVSDDFGLRIGPNLFHSFARLDLLPFEFLTFSSKAPGVRNVLARVTGGQTSHVAGMIRCTIPGANVYLLNPAGIAFSSGAGLDVPAAFAASTADQILLADGGRFGTGDHGVAGLTGAAPSGFAFSSAAPAPITAVGHNPLFDHREESFLVLRVPETRTISLVGGPVTMTTAWAVAPSGRINVLAAGGPGEVLFDPTSVRGRVDLSRLPTRGNITLNAVETHRTTYEETIIVPTRLDVSGDRGGKVFVGSADLLTHQTELFAETKNLPGLGVAIDATGLVRLDGHLFVRSFGSGDAGSVSVRANRIELPGEGGRTYGTVDAASIIEPVSTYSLLVSLDVDHTSTGDLDISLRSPTGTAVLLASGVDSNGPGFKGTTFNSEASTSISEAQSPFSGTFAPQGSLSAFAGENPLGTWTLLVSDRAGRNVGTLNRFSLTLGERNGTAAGLPKPIRDFETTTAEVKLGAGKPGRISLAARSVDFAPNAMLSVGTTGNSQPPGTIDVRSPSITLAGLTARVGLSPEGHAEVVSVGGVSLDGSLGTTGALSGPDYVIPETSGLRSAGGENLFHSFSEFRIGSGESATFTGADSIRRVIVRVTGAPAEVNGPLHLAIPNADLFLLAPSGVLLGPAGHIDVPGSLVLTSAHALGFAAGDFRADSAVDGRVPDGEPHSLRFLAPSKGMVNLVGVPSLVEVDSLLTAGGSLSLVGGPVRLEDSTIRGASPLHVIATAAAGDVLLSRAPNGGAIVPDASTMTAFAPVSLSGSTYESSLDIRGSDVLVNGSGVAFSDGRYSRLHVAASGTVNVAGGLGLLGSGDLTIEARKLLVSGGIGLDDGTNADGRPVPAGSMFLRAHRIDVVRGPVIGDLGGSIANISSYTSFDGGGIFVTTDELHLNNGGGIGVRHVVVDGIPASSTPRGIYLTGRLVSLDAGRVVTDAHDMNFGTPSANVAPISIKAEELRVLNGGQVIAPTGLSTPAGISVDVGTLTLDGRQTPISDSTDETRLFTGMHAGLLEPTNVSAPTPGTGGRVTLTADRVAITHGAEIAVRTTDAPGEGVDIQARSSVLIDGAQAFSASPGKPFTGIRAVHDQRGGGTLTGARPTDISVRARLVDLRNEGSIAASSFGVGDAGLVHVRADERLSLASAASIRATSFGRGAGGTIDVGAPTIVLTDGSAISAANFRGADAGGTVSVSAHALSLTGHSSIDAGGGGGIAQKITVSASLETLSYEQTFLTLVSPAGTSVDLGYVFGGSFTFDDDAAADSQLSTRPVGFLSTFGVKDLNGRWSLELSGAAARLDAWSLSVGNLIFRSTEVPKSGVGITSRVLVGAAAEPTPGRGSNIHVKADKIGLSDGSSVAATTLGTGDGGNVLVEGADVRLTGGSRIESASRSLGQAGSISIGSPRHRVGALELAGGSSVSASAFDEGAGGRITIRAGELTMSHSSTIAALSNGPAASGDVRASVDRAMLASGSAISTRAEEGRAGSIRLDAADSISLIDARPGLVPVVDAVAQLSSTGDVPNTRITAEAVRGDGGNITLNAAERLVLSNSLVTARAANGRGAAIKIDPRFVILNQSVIDGRDATGRLQVSVVADRFLPSADSDILSRNPDLPPATDLAGVLSPLNGLTLQPNLHLAEVCTPRLSLQASSFLVVGRGATPIESGGLVPAFGLEPPVGKRDLRLGGDAGDGVDPSLEN